MARNTFGGKGEVPKWGVKYFPKRGGMPSLRVLGGRRKQRQSADLVNERFSGSGEAVRRKIFDTLQEIGSLYLAAAMWVMPCRR